MSIAPKLIAFAVPVVTAMRLDFGAFAAARKLDPNVRFDWALAGARWAEGACFGFLCAFGVSAAGG